MSVIDYRGILAGAVAAATNGISLNHKSFSFGDVSPLVIIMRCIARQKFGFISAMTILLMPAAPGSATPVVDALTQGKELLIKGQAAEASKLFDQAIKLDPDCAYAYVMRGTIYEGSGELDKAFEFANKAIGLDSKLADAYLLRGKIFEDRLQYEQAIKDCNKAVELAPQEARAYHQRACVFLNMSQYDKAIADDDRAIGFDPSYAPAYCSRAWSYDGLKQYSKALHDYSKAINLDQKLSQAMVLRGGIYDKLGKTDKAVEDFNRAIAVDPTSHWAVEAYCSIGANYAKQLQYHAAIAQYTKALSIDPRSARAFVLRSNAYRELGNHEQAIHDLIAARVPRDEIQARIGYYDGAIKAHPKAAWAYCGRGVSYLKLAAHPKSNWAYSADGESSLKVDAFRRAVEDCSLAISLDATYAPAYMIRGFAYKQLGEHQRAVDDFSSAVRLDPSLAVKIAQGKPETN